MINSAQDGNSVPVGGNAAKTIQKRACDILGMIVTLGAWGDSVSPTWDGEIQTPGLTVHYEKIYQFWPDLRLCTLNWKADKLPQLLIPGSTSRPGHSVVRVEVRDNLHQASRSILYDGDYR